MAAPNFAPWNTDWRRLHQIGDHRAPTFAELFARAVRRARKDVVTSKLSKALAIGNVDRATRIAMASWTAAGAAMRASIVTELRSILRSVGRATGATAHIIDQVGGTVSGSPAGGVHLGRAFNVANPRATLWASEQAATLVTQMDKVQQAVIRGVIQDGFRHGVTPQVLARRMVQQGLGLNGPQAQTLARFRAELQASKHSADRIARLVQRRADKMIRYRSRDDCADGGSPREQHGQAASVGERRQAGAAQAVDRPQAVDSHLR